MIWRSRVRSIGLGVVFLSSLIFLFSGELPLSDLFYRICDQWQFQPIIYLFLNGVIFGGLLEWCEGKRLISAMSLVIINMMGILSSIYMDANLIKSTLEILWSALPSLIVLNYALLLYKHVSERGSENRRNEK